MWLRMLTVKELATRLAFPPASGGAVERGRLRAPLSPAEQAVITDKLLASARSLTDQAEIDPMWGGIVAKLNAEAAAVQPLFERIRHWTREGLLSPTGEKNPGTGRARLYDEAAFRKAKVLNSLTECGFTVRHLRAVIDFLDIHSAEWLTKTASCPDDRVYLVIQKLRWTEDRTMQIRHLAMGDAPDLTFSKTVEYALVVDLTQ
jgi:DNA-binding transcriptional MerR regulator